MSNHGQCPHQKEAPNIKNGREQKSVGATGGVSAKKIAGAPGKHGGETIGDRCELCGREHETFRLARAVAENSRALLGIGCFAPNTHSAKMCNGIFATFRWLMARNSWKILRTTFGKRTGR